MSPHQCVHCGKIYPTATKAIIEGCDSCGHRFFFYIKEEKLREIEDKPIKIPKADKKQIETDIREIAGISEEDAPVILDLESVRIIGSGKFEIDVVNLFNQKRPLIYKLEEGKYIVDLATTLQKDLRDIKEIKDPDKT